MKKLASLLACIVIFLVNIVLVWPLFQGGYTQQIGSIESVFIADARFIFENFPHLGWNPYWYTGFSFHLFYTPFLPFLMALLHFLFSSISIASWYRILIGFFYALTPVSFYFLVSYLTEKKRIGFLAALGYSFLPSISYLMPYVGGNGPWRLLTLILFGEGGHIVGLFFLPLALLFSIKAIRKASWKNVFWASFLIAWLALTNMIALIGFAVMFIVAWLVELMEGASLEKLIRAGLVFLFSFGLVAFWYNFSFIKASLVIGTGGVSGNVGSAYLPFLPLLFLLAPVFWVLATLGKKRVVKPALVAAGWVLIFFLAAFFWFNQGIMLLPQPNRYLPEMDMGVAFILAWLICLLIEKFVRRKILAAFFYILACLLILYSPLRYINKIWTLTAPHQDITQTSEYKVASWLKRNTQGERVYASGSSAFWLNTFPFSWQIPQVRGGNDGVANPWILDAVYQINTAENAPKGKGNEVAIWWLRIFNVSYLVVNFPASEEIFHDFLSPERFGQIEGVEEKFNLNGDVIYKIPLNRPSLAQVVKKTDFENLIEPKDAVDTDALEQYVDYIDGAPAGQAEFSWLDNNRAKIKATLQKNEAIGIQVTYDPGWKAFINGCKVPLKKDVLGFIFLEPENSGSMEIDLGYTRTGDVWLGYLITLATMIGLGFYWQRGVR